MQANRPGPSSWLRALTAGALLTGVLATLACCVAPRQPAPTPPPQVRTRVIMPAPPPPADWRDAPATPGDWAWTNDAGRSSARFAAGLLTIRCDGPGRIAVIRDGSAPARAGLTITTTSITRTLTVIPIAAPAPAISASLAAGDPLLDAMAFSRGRFMVTAPGTAPLYVSSWPEIGRVIEDCR